MGWHNGKRGLFPAVSCSSRLDHAANSITPKVPFVSNLSRDLCSVDEILAVMFSMLIQALCAYASDQSPNPAQGRNIAHAALG